MLFRSAPVAHAARRHRCSHVARHVEDCFQKASILRITRIAFHNKQQATAYSKHRFACNNYESDSAFACHGHNTLLFLDVAWLPSVQLESSFRRGRQHALARHGGQLEISAFGPLLFTQAFALRSAEDQQVSQFCSRRIKQQGFSFDLLAEFLALLQ